MGGKYIENVNIYQDEDDTAEEPQDSHEAAPSSSRDDQATRDAQRAHEEGVARAAKITSENWPDTVHIPENMKHMTRDTAMRLLLLTQYRLIDPNITAEAAIEALKKRGHWHPDENGINTYQPEKTAESSTSKVKGKKRLGSPLKVSAPRGGRRVRFDMEPKGPAPKRRNRGIKKDLPPLSPAGPMPYSPTRDRKEQKKRSAGSVFPIAEQDLIKCKHFAVTEAGIPIRVESGTMICVDYKDYSKMDIYAIHLMPDSPCIDDIVIIISKSNVAFARIAAAQSPEHALLNCKRLTSALNPWLDRSEPISVFVFCPRNEAGEPFYITPHKNDRLNAVYKHFQDFSKGSGTILSDSYFPVPSGGMYCSIKVGPFGEGNDGKVAKNASKASVQGSSAMSLGNKKDLDFNFGQNVSLDTTQGSSQDYDLGISSDLNLWFDSETGQDWLQNFELESFQNTEPENPPVVDSDLLTRLDKLHEMTGEIDQPWSQQEAPGQNNSFPSTNQNHSTGNGQDYMDFGLGFDQQFGQLSSLQKSNQPFGQTSSLQELNQPFGFELFGQSDKTLGQKSSKASSQKYDDNPYREINPKFDRQPTGRPRVLIMDRNGQRVL